MHSSAGTVGASQALLYLCICFYSEDSFPSNSIDLKCKERVTDSDSDNGSGDEGDRKVNRFMNKPIPYERETLKGLHSYIPVRLPFFLRGSLLQ